MLDTHIMKPVSTKCAVPECNKKLGIVRITCKCDKDFCPKHRHSDAHACTFDYMAESKKSLLKYMSTAITATKIEAI